MDIPTVAPHHNTGPVIGYSLAALAALAALLLREMLSPWFGASNPYHTIWAAVVFAAWYCGVGPAVVATLIGALGVWYWFLPPFHSLRMQDPRSEISGSVGFVVLSGLIIALGEANRRTKARLESEIVERRRTEASLIEVHKQLEVRVQERTRALEQKTAELLQKATLLDLANDGIFVRSAEDQITYWNQGAERLYGWTSAEVLGRSTHEVLHTQFPIPVSQILHSDRWEGELRHTRKDGSQITVVSRWTTLRNNDGKPAGWLEINTDITARRRMEEAARRLSGRILSLQDDERRRMARELHDSLGQYLSALKMNLDGFSESVGRQAAVASECSEIVEKCLTETRTISHLLHPPLLDEAGFRSAAQWYAEGFAKRSGIQVDLDLPANPARLHKDVEIALFRVLQEALTNVHRHSGASKVGIRLGFDSEQIRLEVSDNGRGIPESRLQRVLESGYGTGVGLAGMRERLRDLGGALQIESDQTGTLLRIAIPFAGGTEHPAATEGKTTIGVPAA